MFRLFDDAKYDVLKSTKTAFIIAAVFTLPGLLLLAIRGPNLSIEFTGGTLVELRALDDRIQTQEIRAALDQGGIVGAEIQTFGSSSEFVIRARLESDDPTAETTQQTRDAIQAALTGAFGADGFEIGRADAI